MSGRSFRWTLFLVAVFAAPLPMWGVETAWVPPAKQMLLGLQGVFGAVAEVAPGMAALFLLQAGLWAAVAWLFARGFARAIASARPGFRQRIAFVLSGILLAIGVMDPIYVTPYRGESDRSTLVQVYR